MFQILLALEGQPDVVVALEIDEALLAVALGEAGDETLAMFKDASRQVGRHAYVQNAVAWFVMV